MLAITVIAAGLQDSFLFVKGLKMDEGDFSALF